MNTAATIGPIIAPMPYKVTNLEATALRCSSEIQSLVYEPASAYRGALNPPSTSMISGVYQLVTGCKKSSAAVPMVARPATTPITRRSISSEAAETGQLITIPPIWMVARKSPTRPTLRPSRVA